MIKRLSAYLVNFRTHCSICWRQWPVCCLAILLGFSTNSAQASALDGAQLPAWFAIPFVGLLLSIALLPLFLPRVWHQHFGKIAAGWGLMFVLPCAVQYGLETVALLISHTLFAEYLPFIILLLTLFAVAGGICVHGNLHGTPELNVGLLAIGTALASLMGTTGAAMLMVRPLIRANDNRQHVQHVMVFFIFLVANAGGALTPLGDPPLFLGYLQGVDFLWTLKHLSVHTLFLCCSLLAIFYALDKYYYHRREEELPIRSDPTPDSAISIEGKLNFALLALVVALVLMSGAWKPGISFALFGLDLELQNVLRDVGLLLVLGISLKWVPDGASARLGNEFAWSPMSEVAKLFAAIFVTIIPVIAILKAGPSGAFSAVIHAVSDAQGQPINAMYFWASGALSSFLDNAPTYLVFFNTAGGDASVLMGSMAGTLAAISCGSVFMGAMSYIGNAPNMMVKSIAEQRGIVMPSFFAYMTWSCGILLPLFGLMTVLFF
ncbi:sodium:proton antiporter [Undibacterium parvum]|uniref:Sodium:proton antiporter n=1 Tax=Undibacterium parvum TaxID=401471 RepID=A0A3S9HRE2_9BURK|nr:sodium:proton antiporter [Undibacterium parvum]